MKRSLTLIFLLSLSGYLFAQTTDSGTITHDGLTRDYLIDIPTSYDGSQPVALVFNLHGVTSNAGQQRFYSEMYLTAETEGFLLVHPNGIGASWNVGFNAPAGSDVDDVGFISALIDSLSTEYNIDPNQVFSCGMSLGGFMSYRLACELEGRIAAIASITGSMGNWTFNNCNPDRPVPVLQMHGNADDVVPIGGSPGLYPSIENVINFWRNQNNCSDQPVVTQIPDSDPNDGSTVERFFYDDCADDTEVDYWLVDGGEHTWPGAFFNIGVTNQDIEASQEIWNFFERHPHPGASTSISSIQELDIELFPNPTANTLNLENLPEGKVRIQIWNTLGQLELQQAFESHSGRIQISVKDRIAEGVYFLKIIGSDYEGSTSFVKF